MPDNSAPALLKVSGPGELAAAVPHLFGFHPRESLVLVALRGPRQRLGFQMRLDLAGLTASACGPLVERLRFADADDVVALVYTDDGSADGLPYDDEMRELERSLDAAGLHLLDALLVRGGRWLSYQCAGSGCCPAEGRPLPTGVSDVELAATVELGQVTMPDRAALEASIAPYGGIAGESMRQAVDRVLAHLPGSGPEGIAVTDWREWLRPATLAAWDSAVARHADPPATVPHDEAAQILVGLLDVHVRDEIGRRCVAVDDQALYALLHALCRLAPVEVAAAPCTLLGAAAYARGNGALAAIAFERALRASPGYSLARLLDEALQRQVPPTVLRRTWGSLDPLPAPAPARRRRRR